MHGELLLYLHYPETLVRRRARAGPTEARESNSSSAVRPHAVIEAKEVRSKCADLGEAIDPASRVPVAERGSVETALVP
jgi:hypothetical protein